MLTKAEIEHELRFAKNHEKQLGIIAELNDMSVDDVRRILSGIETAPPCDPPKEKPETPEPPKRGRKKGSKYIDANYHKWTKAEINTVRELRESGMLLSAIAKQFNVSTHAINSLVQRFDIRYER